MKRLAILIIVVHSLILGVRASMIEDLPPFERAVALIKYYEGWHTKKNYPYIGYGHLLLPTDKGLNYNITRLEADKLLRLDLMKYCAMFKEFGKDSLLLATLAYNIGPYKILGNKSFPESRLISRLRKGDRNIEKEYLEFCHVNGEVVPSILRRRQMELFLLKEK